MPENHSNANSEKEVIIIQQASSAVGICAVIFAILGLFFLAIIFVPIALILSISAIVRRQYAWGVCALIITIIAAFLSPTIWIAIAGLLSIR